MVKGSSNVLITLTFPGHLLRYQRFFHSGSGSYHNQGLGTLLCPSLLPESPPAMCGLPILISLILGSSSYLSRFQSLITSRCHQQMSLPWNPFPRQILMGRIYSSIYTKFCLSGLVHLHGRFPRHPTARPNSLAAGFRFGFYPFLIRLLKGYSPLLSSDLLSFFFV